MLDVSKPDSGPDVNSLSLSFVEALYADYLRDSRSVSADWRRYFKQVADGNRVPPRQGPSFQPRSIFNPPDRDGGADSAGVRELEMALLQDRVDQLVRAYRVRGHLVANIDPLGMPRPHLPELDPEFYGFTAADMDRPC
jgi:2-oxoglutarate dehydrogenase E1 component